MSHEESSGSNKEFILRGWCITHISCNINFYFDFLFIKRLNHIGFGAKSLDNLHIGIWYKELFGTPIWKWGIKNIYPHIEWLVEHLYIWLENWNLFIKFRTIMFVRTPLEPKKIIRLMLCWFGHEININIIVYRFNVGTLTIA